MAGITCDDFNATVFNLALDSIISNSTFSDATCADTSNSVSVSLEVTVPLVIAAAYGVSVHKVCASERARAAAVWGRRSSLRLLSYLRGIRPTHCTTARYRHS